MAKPPTSDVAFTPSVKREQEKRGSRDRFVRIEEAGGWRDTITPDLAAVLDGVRSIYIGSASADGQPYIQHRGGPAGFLTVLDDKTLGFADYGGNRQYISIGNFSENPRAIIFVMDYARRLRIKLWGDMRVVEDDADLLARVSRNVSAAPERAFIFRLAAWDRNCQQHIPVLVPIEAAQEAMRALESRVRELEAELERLRTGGENAGDVT